MDVGGQHILYNAIAGIITVGATDEQDAQLGADGKPLPDTDAALVKEPKDAPATARMFYVAYIKKGEKAEDRPITFFYNGGPGSSTVWLHMGSLGPKHVVTPGDQHMPAAPYKPDRQPYSLLDTSDLVFIDMPGTGFGRLYGKDKEKAFWGIDEDANAFARFIGVSHQVQPLEFAQIHLRRELRHHPFGGAGQHPREQKSIDLNGVILLSQIFNFTTDIDGPRRQSRRGSAVCAGAAHLRRDRLVSQKAPAAAGRA